MTWPILAWALRSLAAAWFVVEHLALCHQTHARREGTGALFSALLVPGVGALGAWRAGRRLGPAGYVLAAVIYATLAAVG